MVCANDPLPLRLFPQTPHGHKAIIVGSHGSYPPRAGAGSKCPLGGPVRKRPNIMEQGKDRMVCKRPNEDQHGRGTGLRRVKNGQVQLGVWGRSRVTLLE